MTGQTNRPLSPHLQVYKPQLTSVLSITHRGTGVFLSLGSILLSCWLLALAMGPDSHANLMLHIQSWYGQLLLIGFVFSLYYHLSNGIRHLFWDVGMGLELGSTYRSGYIVIIASLLMTAITLLYAYNIIGGAV